VKLVFGFGLCMLVIIASLLIAAFLVRGVWTLSETSSEINRENAYWNSLPKCIWCRDALLPNDRQECEICHNQACIDHCSTSASGEIICLGCKEQLAQTAASPRAQ